MGSELLNLSGKAICELLTTSRMTLNRWVKEGCPRNSDGSYPAPAVVQWAIARVEQKLADRSVSPTDQKWLEKLREFNAKRAQLALEVEQGKYTLTDECRAQIRQIILPIVSVFDIFPDRVAPQLVGKSRDEIHQILTLEFFAARRVLATGARYSDEEAQAAIFASGGRSPDQLVAAQVRAQRGMPGYMKYSPIERNFIDTRDGTVVPEAEAESYVRANPYKDGRDEEREAFRLSITGGKANA